MKTPETTAGDSEVRRIEAAAEHFRPELSDIGAALSQHMLDLFRNRGKPWPAMMHAEQEAVAWAIRDACQDAARKIYFLAAGLGLSVTSGHFKKVVVGDKGITVELSLDREAAVSATLLQGKFVPVTLADMERFVEIRREFDLTFDQQDLPLGADSPENAGDGELIDPTDEIIELGDSTGVIVPPAAGEIQQLALPPNSDLEQRRAEALRDPEGCGHRDALQGFNSSRDPLEPGTEALSALRDRACPGGNRTGQAGRKPHERPPSPSPGE